MSAGKSSPSHPKQPIQPQRRVQQPWPPMRAIAQQEAQVLRLDLPGMLANEPIARRAEAHDFREVEILQIQKSAPHEHRRSLAGPRAKVAAIDQKRAVPAAAEVMVDASPLNPA